MEAVNRNVLTFLVDTTAPVGLGSTLQTICPTVSMWTSVEMATTVVVIRYVKIRLALSPAPAGTDSLISTLLIAKVCLVSLTAWTAIIAVLVSICPLD